MSSEGAIIPNFHHGSQRMLVIVLTICCIVSGTAAAELSAAELAAACPAGFGGASAMDDDRLDTAACRWYLDPCGVCVPDAPPDDWCVPDFVTTADRAALLHAALAAEPGLGARPAAEVVRTLWRRHFPCTTAPPP